MKTQTASTELAPLIPMNVTNTCEVTTVKMTKRPLFQIVGTGLSLLLAGQMLVACQPNNGSPANSSATAPVLEGTGDSGGGNGLKNRVFEAYAVDVTQTQPWKDHIAPIEESLNRASKTSNGAELQSTFTKMAKTSRWYIVPVTLNEIKKQQIGTDLFQDPIEQLALQTSRQEVWIDKAKHDAPNVTDKDRAYLYMHEVVMGIYLLRFQPFREVALRVTDSSVDVALLDLYSKKYPELAPEQPRSLNADDYARIRAMTNYIMKEGPSIKDISVLFAEFSRNKFDARLFPEDQNRTLVPSEGLSELLTTKRKVSLQYLDQWIEAAPKLGRLPTNCAHSVEGLANVTCSMNISIEHNSTGDRIFSLRAQLKSKGVQKTFKIQRLAMKSNQDDIELHEAKLAGLGHAVMHSLGQAFEVVNEGTPEERQMAREGDDFYDVTAFFSTDMETVLAIHMAPRRITKAIPANSSGSYDNTVADVVEISYGTMADDQRLDIFALPANRDAKSVTLLRSGTSSATSNYIQLNPRFKK